MRPIIYVRFMYTFCARADKTFASRGWYFRNYTSLVMSISLLPDWISFSAGFGLLALPCIFGWYADIFMVVRILH